MEKINNVLHEIMEGAPDVSIFGLFSVPNAVAVSWGVMAFLVLISILLTRNLKKVPSKPQMVLEAGVTVFYDLCKQNLGKHWRVYAPWLGSIALYLLVCNLTGLLHIPPPTQNLSVTATLAALSLLLIYGSQFLYQGFWGGLKKFTKPMAFLLPINLMEVAIRPVALCFRLFGNIVAGFIVMEMIFSIAPAFIPVPLAIYFDLFDGILQAVVFVFLTILFTHESIHNEEEEHD